MSNRGVNYSNCFLIKLKLDLSWNNNLTGITETKLSYASAMVTSPQRLLFLASRGLKMGPLCPQAVLSDPPPSI